MSIIGDIWEERYDNMKMEYQAILRKCLRALNGIPNQKFDSKTDSGEYTESSTYDLASEIEKFLNDRG